MTTPTTTAPFSSRSIVDDFILDANEDFTSPTTSLFSNRLHSYRQHAQLVYENLDFDADCLQKFRKSVKALNESGVVWHESEQDLVSALDALANVNAANSLAHDYDPEISAAWLKFCVIFNDLSKLTKGLVQSVRNNLVFPVDNLLKSDLKDKSELKKPLDKALRDFDARVARLEKDLKQNTKEGLNGRIYLSSTDLAELTLKERTSVELELCKFFHSASRIQSKKGSELLQHLIAFYHTQESFYREGLRTVEEFRCYVDTLIDELNDINRKQEEERKRLRKLTQVLESSYLNEIHEKSSTLKSENMVQSMDVQSNVYGDEDYLGLNSSENHSSSITRSGTWMDDEPFGGYLYKKSKRKMRRHWMKRKCEARHGQFLIWHSDESYPPNQINLLTCQVVAHKSEPKEFYIISYERKYHFQAEDENRARRWLNVLKRSQDAVQNRTFHSDDASYSANDTQISDRRSMPNNFGAQRDVRKEIVNRIRSLPGNNRCCDCNSDKDVTWVSTNIGSLHCIDCSGGHRDLGCHISRIESLTLDHLDKASVLVPLSMGNKAVNEIFEAAPSAAREKLSKTSTGTTRKNYVARKYGEKKYVTRGDVGDNLESYLYDAVIHGQIKKILHASALGADVNAILIKDTQENALFVAIKRDFAGSHLPCIQALVQNGASVNWTNTDGDTPMHVCIRLNKPDCLKLVLLGRNIDAKCVLPSLRDLLFRQENPACENVLIKAIENDRNALADIDLPSFLLPSLSTRENLYSDSDDLSLSSSTMSAFGNSPRAIVNNVSPLGQAPPPPPPVSTKPRIPSLHGPTSTFGTHKRSASDSSGGGMLTPGARMVLPPLPQSAEATLVTGNGSTSGRNPTTLSFVQNYTDHGDVGSVGVDGEPAPKPAPRKIKLGTGHKLIKRCRALYDCKADNPDELSFKMNDIIVITKENLTGEDANWMEGYREKEPTKLGVFPVTFVTFET